MAPTTVKLLLRVFACLSLAQTPGATLEIKLGDYKLDQEATVAAWSGYVGAKYAGIKTTLQCASICLKKKDLGCNGYAVGNQEDCFLIYLLTVLTSPIDPGSPTDAKLYIEEGLLEDDYNQIPYFAEMNLWPYIEKTQTVEIEIVCRAKCEMETDFACSLFYFREADKTCGLGHLDVYDNVSPLPEGDIFVSTDIDPATYFDLLPDMTHHAPSNLLFQQTNIETKGDCLFICFFYPGCALAIYDQASTICQARLLGPSFAGEAQQALSPSAEAFQRRTYLMAVGGSNAATDVELLDLTAQQKVCTKPQNFPVPGKGVTGTSIGGSPLVCGGDTTTLCHRYEDGQWTQTSYSILNAGSSSLRFSSVKVDKDTWLVSGGAVIDITEIHPSTGSAVPFETTMPKNLFSHNMLKINETHLFLVNGRPRLTSNAWIYELGSSSWDPVDPTAFARDFALAGVVVRSDGRQEVVIAGGLADSVRVSSCEIFDLGTMTWRTGPSLDNPIYGGASVPYGSTFLGVSGFDADDYTDKIVRYDPDKEDWIEYPQTLVKGRMFFDAFMVSERAC